MSDLPADELERLRAIEERHRALFVNMGAGFALCELVVDGAGRAVDARLLETNPAFERMLAAEPGSLLGRTVLEIIPYLAKDWLRFIEQVATTGQPGSRVDHEPQKDRYFEVRAYCPQRGQAAVQLYDVTEQEQAKERMAERDARLDALVTSAMDAIVSLDVEQRVVLFNPAAEKMFRCSVACAVGADFSQFIAPQPSASDRG